MKSVNSEFDTFHTKKCGTSGNNKKNLLCSFWAFLGKSLCTVVTPEPFFFLKTKKDPIFLKLQKYKLKKKLKKWKNPEKLKTSKIILKISFF